MVRLFEARWSSRRIHGGLAVLVCLILWPTAAAAVQVVGTSYGDRWTRRDEPITVTLDKPLDSQQGTLHVLVGKVDMTAASKLNGPNVIEIDPSIAPLPEGKTEIVLYLAKDGDTWTKIAHVPLKVLSSGGFEQAEWVPKATFGLDSRWATDNATASTDPQGETRQNVTMQGSLTTRHVKGDLSIQSDFNFLGASEREKALRYQQEGVQAPKLDLSDYLVKVKKGAWQVKLGSVTYGDNPLLLDSLATRGIVAHTRISPRFDASISSMNATAIAGYDNFTGLDNSDNNVSAVTTGLELLANRPGGLRLETTFMTASRLPDSDFNVAGEVPEPETSRGYGVRLTGASESGRLRGNVVYAVSRFTNSANPALAQGDTLVAVAPTTDAASHFDASYALLQDQPLTAHTTANLTLSLSHDRVDAQYKSLGASPTPNQLRNQLVLDGQIGQASAQLRFGSSQDNLDNLDNILTTKIDTTALNLGLPLSALLGTELKPSLWWPSLTVGWQRVHQFAGNRPDPAKSGFKPNALPEEVDTTNTLELNWTHEHWVLGYRFAWTGHDNRQPGFERNDTINKENDLSLQYQRDSGFMAGASYSTVNNTDQGQSLTDFTNTAMLNVAGPISEHWSYASDYSDTREHDTSGIRRARNDLMDVQLNWKFDLPSADKKIAAQLFFRYAMQDSVQEASGTALSQRTWIFTTGVTMGPF